MRIPPKYLEHRVNVRRLAVVGTSVSPSFTAWENGVPCIIVDGSKVVTDQRADSATNGQEVIATCHVLMQPEKYADPGSVMRVWIGDPLREREVTVVATAYARHSIAPESAQAWCV